jgi:hypothetical protein
MIETFYMLHDNEFYWVPVQRKSVSTEGIAHSVSKDMKRNNFFGVVKVSCENFCCE